MDTSSKLLIGFLLGFVLISFIPVGSWWVDTRYYPGDFIIANEGTRKATYQNLSLVDYLRARAKGYIVPLPPPVRDNR